MNIYFLKLRNEFDGYVVKESRPFRKLTMQVYFLIKLSTKI